MSFDHTGSAWIALFERARRAWPGIEVEAVVFKDYFDERVELGTDSARVHVEDLYLACACARGDLRALDVFEAQLMSQVGDYLKKVDPSTALADEVRQILRTKMFVADGPSRAKILDYTGRGALGGWLRVVAIRIARDLKRAQRRRAPAERKAALELRPAAADPELQVLKASHAHEFRAAFQTTLAALSPKERNVLALYYLEGMTSSAIGSVYRVSGAAVRLWIKEMRTKLLDETRRLLVDRLGITSSELDGILLQSQLDLSISRFLGRAKASPAQGT